MNNYKRKLNLIQSGISDFNYGDIIIYNQHTLSESFNLLTYLSNDTLDIISRDVYEIDEFKDELFYFVFPTSTPGLIELFSDVLSYDCEFSKQVIKLLKSDNVRTVFIDVHEVHQIDWLNEISNKFNKLDVNFKNIFWINNDFNLNFYKKKYNWHFNVGKTNHLIHNTCKGMLKNPITFVENKQGPFFLCKNKMPRPHRISILSFLDKFGLIDDTNFSLLRPNFHIYYDSTLYQKLITHPSDMDIVNKYLNSTPINTISEINRIELNNPNLNLDFAGEVDSRDYSQSYINITTESVFFEDNIHLSEKSFKPFTFYQLPIIVSSANHVKVLRDYYKFDLFDDLINHSYDSEADNSKRFAMIVDEIRRLYSIKDIVKKYYIENKHRLEYNRNIIYEISKPGIDVNLFNSIIKKMV